MRMRLSFEFNLIGFNNFNIFGKRMAPAQSR
jgi:hypothetical protein